MSRGLDEGAAHFAAGRLEAAARAYRRVERRAPDDIRAVYSLAVIDLRCGRPEPARRRLQMVVARAPDHVAAWHNLAVARQQLRDWAGAAEAYQQALTLQPGAAATRLALATALTVLGRPKEAIAHYRILAGAPATRWAALTRIALIDPAEIDETSLAGMQRAAVDGGLDPETGTGLFFALGEVLEQRGDAGGAFAAYAAGNRAKRAALLTTSPPAELAAANAAAVDHLRRTFTPEFLAANAGKGSQSAAPIFVVGFPRSGSTLIEQILASHPGVQGLGETGLLPRLLQGRYPPGPRIPAAKLRELAERYLDGLKALGWDGRSRVVDKTLENYLHVGLIALLFPRAVILHSVREPLATGVSCFRQLFVSGNETLYDLSEIGAEYRRYQAAMSHWREVLPGRVIDVEHEALTAEPEPGIRALVAAAGLPWDPATLRFHEREGAVATASASQVRRPIFRDAVPRWRAYEAHLGPLKAALAGEGDPR